MGHLRLARQEADDLIFPLLGDQPRRTSLGKLGNGDERADGHRGKRRLIAAFANGAEERGSVREEEPLMNANERESHEVIGVHSRSFAVSGTSAQTGA
jgi:hypothetical protein